jgi:aspartyl-tRNA(Asn)/glutamyl-tRNA(Gln) amidotransferase subunit A
VPVPESCSSLAASDDEAASRLKGKRLGLPREYFVAAWSPDVEKRIRGGRRAEAAGATVEEVSLPHTDYGLRRYHIVAPAERRRTSPATTGSAAGAAWATATTSRTTSRPSGLRGGGQAPGHARERTLSAGYYDATT